MQTQSFPQFRVVEQWGIESVNYGESPYAVIPAVGEDEGRPFCKLRVPGRGVGLEREEGGKGVGARIFEGQGLSIFDGIF